MEIIIKVLNKDSAPKERAKKPSLEERVEHAIDCVTCEINKEKAIDFLQRVQVHLDGQDKQTKKLQVLHERVMAVLSPYGLKTMPNKEGE